MITIFIYLCLSGPSREVGAAMGRRPGRKMCQNLYALQQEQKRCTFSCRRDQRQYLGLPNQLENRPTMLRKIPLWNIPKKIYIKNVLEDISKYIQDMQTYTKIYRIPRCGGAARPGPGPGLAGRPRCHFVFCISWYI